MKCLYEYSINIQFHIVIASECREAADEVARVSGIFRLGEMLEGDADVQLFEKRQPSGQDDDVIRDEAHVIATGAGEYIDCSMD